MNKILLGGVVLIGLGILFLVLGSVEFTKQEEVLRVGTFSATATTARTIQAFRYVGVGLASGGIILVIFGFKRRGK